MASRPRKNPRERDPLRELSELARPVAPPAAEPASANDGDVRRYQDLFDVATSLTSTLDLKSILDAIVDGIIRMTGCDRGYVILREEDGKLAMFTGRTRGGAAWEEEGARHISHSVVEKVEETHQLFVGADIAQIDDLREQGSIVEEKIRSAVCLPLIDQGRLVGVIYADSRHVLPSFTDDDGSLLHAFGAQAAVAIVRARVHGEVLTRGERLKEQNQRLRQQLAEHVTMSGMVIRNKQMLDVFEVAQKIAPSDMRSVLIHGESGTGKELLARAIHEMSPRRGGPFEAINCASIPHGLADSILFGHCKGAFTGADADRPGYFELADGGTLFLDEIAEMPLETQPKLLRALELGEITRVGEQGHVRKVDVHVVAATNRDLPHEAEAGRFRHDLYFRLKGAQLHLPPLRERREDILPLAEYFLQRVAKKRGVPPAQLSRDARTLLLGKRWDGNVRELEHAMEWASAFQDDNGVIQAGAFDRFFAPSPNAGAALPTDAGSFRDLMDSYEERLIRDALARNDGNISNTARALDLSRQMLHLKIKKYGIKTRES
ncbi:MAG TPA: sigma 54-interacting transcriptional regulator [Candidatus Krumholzibacteria bacterium]|nr:sigma 54-interacting transcriptional regulator [Candidatus Krumholzibacteria bacterium]